MNRNCTELVFILDRSGSMAGLESDTIGGFNAMLEKQKKQEGACWVSTVLFASESAVIHDRLPLEKVPPLTEKEYSVGGCTALLDAIGGAVKHVANIHKYARPEDVPAHTLFVITTDGLENASHRYGSAEVKRLIERKKEEGWEFLFLGANIDAVETAGKLGIARDRAANYHADRQGTRLNFIAVSDAVGAVRMNRSLDGSWKEDIDADFESRKQD